MITELMKTTTDPANRTAFEAALKSYFARMHEPPGFKLVSISQEVESAAHHYVQIEWKDMDAHLAMKGSPAAADWSASIVPFFTAPTVVVHLRKIGPGD